MPIWSVVVLALVVALAVAWHLSYTAARLDRLHARVEGSLAALDAQLVRRAEVALELGNAQHLDPASSFLLSSTAARALRMAEGALITDEVQEVGIPPERAEAESELTDALVAVSTEWTPQTEAEEELRRRLVDAAERVQLAHRFHNEAVLDVRRVRAKAVVRVMHLAGHTHMPRTVDFDDALPVAPGEAPWGMQP